LAKLLASLRKTGGWDGLTELIYNSAATLNGFDQYGHFSRTLVTLTTASNTRLSLPGVGMRLSFQRHQRWRRLQRELADLMRLLGNGSRTGAKSPRDHAEPGSDSHPPRSLGESRAPKGTPNSVQASATTRGTAPLLDYLLGHEQNRSASELREQPILVGRDGVGRDRRRLPRLQRQQRAAVRLDLRPHGAAAQRRRLVKGNECGSAVGRWIRQAVVPVTKATARSQRSVDRARQEGRTAAVDSTSWSAEVGAG